MNDIKVSVCCFTYNHAPYLSKALDSVLSQKTNFRYEIIIGDDCSTDGSQDIINAYAIKFPDLIKTIYQPVNSRGKKNFSDVYKSAEGQYVIALETDDYWTDPYKLQKQIDFLECYSDYVICSHRYRICLKEEKVMNDEIKPIGDLSDGMSFDLSFLIRGGWLFQPLSVVYRKSALDLDTYSKYAIYIDVALFYAILKNGKGYCMPDVMGVYRIHEKGVWSGLDLNHQRIFSLKAREAIYDVEKTDEAAMFILSQFSRPMGRFLVVKECSMFMRITKILISHFGLRFVLRMWFDRLFLNKKLCVNEFYQIKDFCKRKKNG